MSYSGMPSCYYSLQSQRTRELKNKDNEITNHTSKKVDLLNRIKFNKNHTILETNCGTGKLTEYYKQYGYVFSVDKDSEKIKILRNRNFNNVKIYNDDNLQVILFLKMIKQKFDVIDLDDYGWKNTINLLNEIPSLIDNGIVFMTFPKNNIHMKSEVTKKSLVNIFQTYQYNVNHVIDYTRRRFKLNNKNIQIITYQPITNKIDRYLFAVN